MKKLQDNNQKKLPVSWRWQKNQITRTLQELLIVIEISSRFFGVREFFIQSWRATYLVNWEDLFVWSQEVLRGIWLDLTCQTTAVFWRGEGALREQGTGWIRACPRRDESRTVRWSWGQAKRVVHKERPSLWTNPYSGWFSPFSNINIPKK